MWVTHSLLGKAVLFHPLKALNLQAYQTKKSGDSKILLTHEPGDAFGKASLTHLNLLVKAVIFRLPTP
jgi:hypothetical protein